MTHESKLVCDVCRQSSPWDPTKFNDHPGWLRLQDGGLNSISIDLCSFACGRRYCESRQALEDAVPRDVHE